MQATAKCGLAEVVFKVLHTVAGSLCLRLGPADVWDDNNAFRPLSSTFLGFGTCHAPGMSLLSYGPEAASSLQACKLKCMSTPSCRGIAFNSTGCFVWLGSGTLSTNPDAESICLSYEPFRDVDGGVGRDCRGHDGSDLDSSYFVQFPGWISASLSGSLCTTGRRRCSRKAMQGNCIRLNRWVMPSLGSFSGHWCNSRYEQCCMSEI